MKYTILLLFVLCVNSICADTLNPIFWERSFTLDISQANSEGTLIQSTSFMATSQDFQGIHVDSNPRNPPDRIIFNFGESCQSSNTTMDTILQLSSNSISAAAIENAQKIALVKRGNCKWSEKLSVVNNVALANKINITAMFIYDNGTHNDTNIIIARKPVVGFGDIGPPDYATPLPADRSVLNMTDNDLGMASPSTTVVYFVPNVYGVALVDRISKSYNASHPNMRTFWLITPYLEEVSWGYAGGEGFFSNGKGYLSYIIGLAAFFLIGVIFLRWWRMRRMGAEYPNGFTGSPAGNGLHMQPRRDHLDPLPVYIVNALPIDKYAPDLIKNINCAICLEDFVTGKNDIRMLPCGHGFCVLCIDPWLTQKSSMCPICKWDCLPTEIRHERNQHQFQQQQPQQQNESPNRETVNAASTTINMSASGPSTTATTTVIPVDEALPTANTTHTTTNTTTTTTTTTGSIIPPPIFPASSPPPSPRPVGSKMTENPFEPGEMETSATHVPFHHINLFDQTKETGDFNEKPSTNPFNGISETGASTLAHTTVAMEEEEKKAPSKDQH